MFDDRTDGDLKAGDDDLFLVDMRLSWPDAAPTGGEGPDTWAGRAADDLRERLRRSGGRLPGSDPRR